MTRIGRRQQDDGTNADSWLKITDFIVRGQISRKGGFCRLSNFGRKPSFTAGENVPGLSPFSCPAGQYRFLPSLLFFHPNIKLMIIILKAGTPIPTITAVIRCCAGYAIESAVIVSSPMRDTHMVWTRL
mgnify:FL=1